MAGEYGEKYGRPHYHALIFGHRFDDRKFLRQTGSGFNIYSSSQLAQSWPFGHSSVGDLTFESAAYVARYCLKKISGPDSDVHYLDAKTGVIREKEFTNMSRGGRKKGHGGIGAPWYEKFQSDCYPFGTKIVNGVECKTPRYYDSLYEKDDPRGFAKLKAKRNSLIDVVENSVARLLVKEEVTLSKISKLKRELEFA